MESSVKRSTSEMMGPGFPTAENELHNLGHDFGSVGMFANNHGQACDRDEMIQFPARGSGRTASSGQGAMPFVQCIFSIIRNTNNCQRERPNYESQIHDQNWRSRH
jgi:hypothetical protein